MNNVEIRILHELDEMEAVRQLEIEVWNANPEHALSSHLLFVIAKNGGIIMGAWKDQCLIGFVMGFIAKRQQEYYIYSHIAGVKTEWQGYGIGEKLKQAQRQWALQNGYALICWTFDPLQRMNASFNIHKLRVIVQSYHVNLYGDMPDGLNHGLATDRFTAEWYLKDPRILNRPMLQLPLTKYNALVHYDNNTLYTSTEPLDGERCTLQIPYDTRFMKMIDMQLVQAWQNALREAFQLAFNSRYRVVDFVTDHDAQTCWYVLSQIEQ